MMQDTSIIFMERCLQLALKGAGQVAPNPMVGAVLVHNGLIIGEGWHKAFGYAHAEVDCVKAVSEEDNHLICESTLYVSLEPCAHHGKTPPCASFIIQHRIPKVVIGCRDSYREVAGKGIAMLQAAGVEVVVGILEHKARQLNRRFFTFHEKKRPFVLLKWARSRDGFLGPEEGRKVMLSNTWVQRWVHKLRHEEAAILVGYRTALLDNPQLSNRYYGSNQPVRLVIDLKNELPSHLHLFDGAQRTLVFTTKVDEDKKHVVQFLVDDQQPIVPQVLAFLYHVKIQSVIVEGGAKTLEAFIEADLWDEAYEIETPAEMGTGLKAPLLNNAKLVKSDPIGDNVIKHFEHVGIIL